MPEGWLDQPEAEALYALARDAAGPILEVGAWVGRSTCALALGVRDSARPQRFDVVDFGICGMEDWRRRFAADPGGTEEAVAKIVRPILQHGGTAADLIQNLADRDLMRFIKTLAIGALQDFSTATQYSLIFADCMHDEEEIGRNLPSIKSLMGKGCILACDDVIDDATAQRIQSEICAVRYSIMRKEHPYSKVTIFWTRSEA